MVSSTAPIRTATRSLFAPHRSRSSPAARGRVERGDLLDLLRAEAPRLAGALPAEGRESAVLLRLADDPFARGGPPMRAFDATIELLRRFVAGDLDRPHQAWAPVERVSVR